MICQGTWMNGSASSMKSNARWWNSVLACMATKTRRSSRLPMNWSVTRERVRQIQMDALKRLRGNPRTGRFLDRYDLQVTQWWKGGAGDTAPIGSPSLSWYRRR